MMVWSLRLVNPTACTVGLNFVGIGSVYACLHPTTYSVWCVGSGAADGCKLFERDCTCTVCSH